MPRMIALVDGFNLYHSLQENPAYHKYKWLNIDKLLRTYFPVGLEKIYYFTSYTPWDLDKVARHRVFIQALESTGVEVVYGKFKDRDRKCPICKARYRSREEKQTDVSIALKLFRLAYEKRYDEAILVTGDSDQLPSFREVHKCFPGLKLGVLLPIGREAAELKTESDFYSRIRERVIAKCKFDQEVTLADGTVLRCPSDWMEPPT
jgi:uncharacterized LabA/DUF88 family protein